MDKAFHRFVKTYKNIFEAFAPPFDWSFEVNQSNGKVDKSECWIVNQLTNSKHRFNVYLNNFSTFPIDRKNTDTKVISVNWQELIKAEVTRRSIEQRLAPATIRSIATALRIIATVAKSEPWLVTQQNIIESHKVAMEQQPSGINATYVTNIAKDLFDTFRISKYCPIYTKLKSQKTKARRKVLHVAKAELNDRLNAEKLPQAEEFSDLINILSMKAKRQVDTILFAAIKLMLILGFRVNEVCLIPLDWKREEMQVDQFGNPVKDESGKALKTLYIRYFAEKQDEREIYEPRRVPVPLSFQAHVIKLINHIIDVTKDMRQKLIVQEATGNAQIFHDDVLSEHLTPFDIPPMIGAITNDISAGVGHHIYMPRERIMKRYNVPRYHGKLKVPWGVRSNLDGEYYKAQDVQEALIKHFKTKLSNISPIVSQNGKPILKASDALFLLPRRAKAKEASGKWYYDWSKYLFVSPLGPEQIDCALSGKGKNENIFEIYLNKPAKLNTHSLRHLRSSELIRAQVSDMIHAKTMGRKSLAQNYEYDHRSVKESLSQLDVTEKMLIDMPIKARITLEKALDNKLGGTIVKTFNEIQNKNGIQEAINWLSAHADAMHVTPYGACVANMVTNPCPKHLQCFMGCSHFVKDDRASSSTELHQLLNSSKKTLGSIKNKVQNGDLSKAHFNHAKNIIDNIEEVIAAPVGSSPFNKNSNSRSYFKAIEDSPKTALDLELNLEVNEHDKKTSK